MGNVIKKERRHGVTLSLDRETDNRLRSYAKKRHTTISQAVTDWLWEMETPMFRDRVVVYHEYNDANSYLSQVMRVFASPAEARAFLRKRVKQVLGKSLAELRRVANPEIDVVEEDRVYFDTMEGTWFFFVEPFHISSTAAEAEIGVDEI